MDRTPLDDLARPTAGIVNRSCLLDAGWSSSAVSRALSRGQLQPVARGVYRTAGAPFSRRAAHHAAIALLGDSAVLSRWTAAELLGVADPRPGPVHVAIPEHHRRPRGVDRLVRVHRVSHEIDRTTIDGLPVATAARTLLDLAPLTSIASLTELVAAATRVGATSLAELREVVRHHPWARARRRLIAVLDLLGDDGDRNRSNVEALALHAIVAAGLPRPAVAHLVRDREGRFLAEVDLAYPEVRIAIEIDGFRWHSSPARKLADEQRQNRLALAGWTVLRFSASEVAAHPDRVVAAVAAALRAADTRG